MLSGLKEYSGNVTAVVTVADDGGSSGRLRESLNMVAPGDLTDCYAALSDSPALARLLLHRFDRGEGLEGHTFGNLLLATLSEEQGGLATAMQDIHDILRVRGRVYPATTVPATLVARLSDGRVVRGESHLSSCLGSEQVREVSLEPADLPALPEVIESIYAAELIVLGPGSLFTSVMPVLLVPAIAAALRSTPARLVYVAPLMTEPGETTGMTLEDHFAAITAHLGRAPDYILANSAVIAPYIKAHYAAQGAAVLDTRRSSRNLRGRILFAPLLKHEPVAQARHDPEALAQALHSLLERMHQVA
ncbi:uridine diphosphate-N-acetylglucosamine-binding protein YvcK [Deinococcus lacus]|uniref:Putative gluconeogenesis factor n=1 Tax=Deinococcus lacus TaxID=392561 RepID=A0ABW1Y9Z3_9DEIO